MGCDIHGAIEADGPHGWDYLADLGWLVGRSYSTFGCLFGVRNYAGFDPAFEGRGFPSDRSWKLDSIIEDYAERDLIGAVDCHSPSYAWLDELLALDWDERAEELGERYSVLDEHGEPTGTKFSWAHGLDELDSEQKKALDDGERIEWGNDRCLQRLQISRREALSGAWEWFIFDHLPAFGRRYDYDNIRVVVWFDN